ncbi:MAG: hypothetical protein IPH28_01305 [Cytophagaceae bacterium]|nr:hypothetical protein [Cytophagaceae bacterium]
MRFFNLSVVLLLVNGAIAQSFTAKTGYLYLGEKDTELNGGMEVLSGIIKKNEKIDIYAPSGRKFTATIVKISGKNNDELSQVKAGEYGYFDLKFTENPSTGKDYINKDYKVYPAGFKVNSSQMKAEADAKTASVNFKSKLNGKNWNAKVTYKGASFWRKGVKGLLEKPYMQLQFASVQTPDERLITIQVLYPKESPAKYVSKDLEVNFSGTPDGNTAHTEIYGFVNGKGNTDFSLEITKWQKVSSSKAIISGKISGDLKEVKLLGTPKLIHRFTDGVFENIEVEIFNEQANFKQMIKSAGGESQKN